MPLLIFGVAWISAWPVWPMAGTFAVQTWRRKSRPGHHLVLGDFPAAWLRSNLMNLGYKQGLLAKPSF